MSYETYETFEELGLNESLILDIKKYGYEKPTLLQQKVIKPFLTEKDIIITSKYGSGKTITSIICMLQQIDYSKEAYCQSIIMMSSPEGALNNNEIIKMLGASLNIKSHCCIGGRSLNEDVYILRKGVHIMIGTPRRILSLLHCGTVDIEKVKLFIIDEAENLLSKINRDFTYAIVRSGKEENIQICLNCSTITTEIDEFINKCMIEPYIT